ncbi:hypothetical protein [Pantoea agglomerans]|uniref:ParE family toxin-like protein n=1 Tax=Enterobacter agglomerans TaxID=549 RepID=UPI0024138345|nr:hypothetical protein [Pantoea agglomerans]
MPGCYETAPGLYVPLHVPPGVLRRAVSSLNDYRAGLHCCRRLNDGRGTGNLKINVGRRWRLLSRNDGATWELMTHERYNTARRR